jgi:hypothetical protein
MKSNPIKEGMWLYGDASPVRVQIEKTNLKPGSGDYEDADEDREDKAGEFFHLVYSAAGDVQICNDRGYFLTLNEAIQEAERVFSGIKWK